MRPVELLALLSHSTRIQLQDLKRAESSCAELESPSVALQWLEDEPGIALGKNGLEVCSHLFERREMLLTKSIHHIYPGHAHYPVKFFSASPVPLSLYFRGTLPTPAQACLGVVGSREVKDEVRSWMDFELGQYLRHMGGVVVSGGARGVDQMAHSVALRHQIPTIAFLPSGLQRIYPADFNDWVSYILDSGGGIVSELPPEVEMRRFHFEKRNRLIAALSDTVFVVQAARASGSLLTAKHGIEQGKSICVLPQSPFEPSTLGGLDLIVEGAHAVRDWQDLLVVMKLARSDLCKVFT